MMKTRIQSFHEDTIELAVERYRSGKISRRLLIAGLGAIGATPLFVTSGRAQGDVRQIVMANWGGDSSRAMEETWCRPYTEATGIEVITDGSGPSLGQIRNMVESGNVIWDVCDANAGSSEALGRADYLEEVDYSVVDREKLLEGFRGLRWGVSNYLYSFVPAFDRRAFDEGATPNGWVDFWNIVDFPGMRALRQEMDAHLEAALMSTGMPIEDVYPLDREKIELAFSQIRKLRPHTIFWRTGAESQQLMRNREVTMGLFWNTRAAAMHQETDGAWDWTWNQGILYSGAWAVPRGNPAGPAVWDFVRSMQQPESQLVLLEAFSNAPANPAAAALVPEELKKFNATDPDNVAVQLPVDWAWYGENYAEVNAEYLDLIAE